MGMMSRLAVPALLVLAAIAQAGPQQVQTLWRLLDYIAVDYPEAVHDGAVVNALEYDEMREFSASVSERLARLPADAALPELRSQAAALEAAIEARAAPAEIERRARGLGEALLTAYPVPRAPATAPDLARAPALYQQHCAGCHGARGGGDGPAAAGMDPPPVDFTNPDRARQRSLFALQQVIEQGLEGTSMPSFAHLPEAERWALAFHVGQFAFPEAAAARGGTLWRQSPALRAAVPDLAALVQRLPADTADLPQADADALSAWLRRNPAAVDATDATLAATRDNALALARGRLREAVEAYAAGDHAAARDLMLSAYLEGIEPVEPLIAARDRGLLIGLESGMARVRGDIAGGASSEAVRDRAIEVEELLDRADALLSDADSAGAATTFASALTILLREGLEALLLVIAMVAFLRKAGRSEALPYVHAGWIGALLAGTGTWLAATRLVEISGASREITEGIAGLVAAAVLVSVGIWMHGKSQADAWQRYIRDKLSHALSRGSAWFLFGLAFVVVYREAFETVLFYTALWSQGQHSAILAGAATAVSGLALLAWAMLRFSQRLPFGRFFSISSVLVAVLAVVLAGKGVAALQEAGRLPLTLVAAPRIDLLGLHPTLQGLAVQLAVLAMLGLGFVWNTRRARAIAAGQA